MGDVYFYHLTDRPLEATLPALLTKSLSAGWRVAVRAGDTSLVARLDDALWNGEGFIPHGKAGGPHDTDQPILITTGEASNNSSCLMVVGDASFAIEEANDNERICVLFDGGNASSLEHAREQWRTVTAAGLKAQYWADEGGRWTKKAENAPES